MTLVSGTFLLDFANTNFTNYLISNVQNVKVLYVMPALFESSIE